MKQFYDLGGRCVSLAHDSHSLLADSNSGERDNIWFHKASARSVIR